MEFRSAAIVPLFVYRRAADDDVLYSTAATLSDAGFVREEQALCRVWKAPQSIVTFDRGEPRRERRPAWFSRADPIFERVPGRAKWTAAEASGFVTDASRLTDRGRVRLGSGPGAGPLLKIHQEAQDLIFDDLIEGVGDVDGNGAGGRPFDADGRMERMFVRSEKFLSGVGGEFHFHGAMIHDVAPGQSERGSGASPLAAASARFPQFLKDTRKVLFAVGSGRNTLVDSSTRSTFFCSEGSPSAIRVSLR